MKTSDCYSITQNGVSDVAVLGFVSVVVFRASHASWTELDYEDSHMLRFAPAKLLTGGGSSPCVVNIWRRQPYLCLSYHRRRLPSCAVFLPCLLLCAGDVERNPGPVRYPCTVCTRPVRSDQRGILCDRCELWTHARCCGVSVVEYERLGLNVSEEWLCPACLSAELPFANVSLGSLSSDSHLSLLATADSEDLSPLMECRVTPVLCHLNVQSLLPKMDEIRAVFLDARRPVIVGLSETWLDSSVQNGEVNIPSFVHYRRDRGSRGGEVMIYVPESYRSRRRADLEDAEIEIIWIELHLKKKIALIGNMYRPPNAVMNVYDQLGIMLDKVASERKEIILMGDLNCDMLKQSSMSEKLTMVAEEHNLTQLISEPTRITNHSQTLIDVLFSSSAEMFSSTGTLILTSSDHLMIYGELTESTPAVSTVSFARSFKKCDREILLSELESAPWQVMDIADSIDDKWDSWKKLFFSIVDRHAPLRKVRVKKDKAVWMDEELHALMKTRNYYRRKYYKTRSQDYWNRYKALSREVTPRQRKGKADYYINVCQNLSEQPRQTWRQLNKVLGRNRNKPVNALGSGDRVLTNAADIVNKFVSHFSTLSTSTSLPKHQLQLSPSTSTFNFSEIKQEEVLRKLSSLDISKATGSDNISAKLLRMVAPAIARSLTTMFNESLSTGKFPVDWKQANVSPVPKSGDKHDVNNYRPVSVIPVIAKVFESLVHDQLYRYLDENKLLNAAQSGFRLGHSTQDVLLKTVDDWRISLDDGKIVGTVLIDLSKAFDMIDHHILLSKLESFGPEFAWFSDYLNERKQRVVLNGAISEWRQISRGVPQGSILRPLLFVLFVNDLPDVVQHCTVNLYADDTTIYVADDDPEEVGRRLEEDLRRIAEWIDCNSLKMNVSKTQLMVLSRRGKRQLAQSVKVHIGDKELHKQGSVKWR